MSDERWRPAGEPPECEDGEIIRVIFEAIDADGNIYTSDLYYLPRLGWDRVGIRRWRYFPEPPTPEDEARREREGRALARAAAISLTVCRLGAAILTDDERAILRELAARGPRHDPPRPA